LKSGKHEYVIIRLFVEFGTPIPGGSESAVYAGSAVISYGIIRWERNEIKGVRRVCA
jgi:hypothetical protein